MLSICNPRRETTPTPEYRPALRLVFFRGGKGAFVLTDLACDGLTGPLPRASILDNKPVRLTVAVQQAVDFGDHVTRDHVPAPESVFTIRPVVNETDNTAKAACELPHLAYPRDQVVRGSDDRSAHVGESNAVYRFVRRFIDHSFAACQRSHGVLVVVPHQAVPCLFPCLFSRFSYVPAEDDSPVLPVDCLAVLGCRFLGEAPLHR